MTSDSDTVRHISWLDCCPWLLLLRCFRVAVSLQVLLLAAMGALATTAGWRLADRCFLDEDVTSLDVESVAKAVADATPSDLRVATDARYFNKWPGQRGAPGLPGLCPYTAWLAPIADAAPADPVSTMPYHLVVPVRRIFDRGLSWWQLGYYLVGGVWTLTVWSLFGGAIARMAVMQLGREEQVDLREAIDFSRGKLASQAGAIIMPLFGVSLLAVPMLVLGLIMSFGIGTIFGGIIWLLVIIAAALTSVLLLGLLFGWPIMFCTLAAEGTDAFDAISRGYAYSFQRPMRYLFYAFAASFFGLLGWLLVWGFSEAVVEFGYWGVSWGTGQPRMDAIAGLADSTALSGDLPSAAAAQQSVELGGADRFGAQMVGLWNGLIRTIASAYGYSFLWCAAAAIYLLLRLDIDSTEWDQLYVAENPNVVYGMPQLKTDATGVPDVSDATSEDGEVSSDEVKEDDKPD